MPNGIQRRQAATPEAQIFDGKAAIEVDIGIKQADGDATLFGKR
jgi:hypothetical protein